MVSSDSPGVGSVEEVMCDPSIKMSALSVPLFQGRQTVGVLLVWLHLPDVASDPQWTKGEKEQISSAAQSLSLALSMDSERRRFTEAIGIAESAAARRSPPSQKSHSSFANMWEAFATKACKFRRWRATR